jgi:hypothetical protein
MNDGGHTVCVNIRYISLFGSELRYLLTFNNVVYALVVLLVSGMDDRKHRYFGPVVELHICWRAAV